MAGYHEVIYTEKTKEAVEKWLEEKGQDVDVWRVSSTLFSHLRHDVSLKHLDELKDRWSENADAKYPDVKAYDSVMEELKAIHLWGDDYE